MATQFRARALRVDVTRHQSIQQHIMRLEKWRDARVAKSLDVVELENAIILAETFLNIKGYSRVGKNVMRTNPHLSIGLLEQIQKSLTDGKYTATALQNVQTLIEQATKIATNTEIAPQRCEMRHVYVKDDQCDNRALPGMKACAHHKCSIRECPNVRSIQRPLMGDQFCSEHSYLAPLN